MKAIASVILRRLLFKDIFDDPLCKLSSLYWSPGLEKRLGTLWWLGINKLRNKKFEDNQLEETLVSEIADLHAQMKQDLQLSEIARILQEAR